MVQSFGHGVSCSCPSARWHSPIIPKERTSYATGLFNLARNIGGSSGIATVTTLLARRAQIHQHVLVSHLTPYDSAYRDALAGATQLLHAHGATLPDAAAQAQGLLYGSMLRQSEHAGLRRCVLGDGDAVSVDHPADVLDEADRAHAWPDGDGVTYAESRVAMPETEERPAVAEPEKKSPVRFVVAILLVVAAGWACGLTCITATGYLPTTRRWRAHQRHRSQDPGNVLEVLVNDNQPVKAGRVLVRIDPRDYQAAVDMAKAALAQAESQLRAARVVVPWTDDTTESLQTPCLRAAGRRPGRNSSARAWPTKQASSSDLAYAEANVRARRPATIAPRPTWPA